MSFLRKIYLLNNAQTRFYCQQAIQKTSRIGFIGLGQMGYRMSGNLVKKGFDVTVYDKNNETVKQFHKEQGGRTAETPQKLVSEVDCIITMLPVGQDILNLYSEPILKSIKPGTVVIDSSTIEHTVSQELESKFKSVNACFIDAPVSGGIIGAENATLAFMVGGEEKTMKRAEQVLKGMGANIFYCGPSGSGQIAKACNNLILGITMAGLSEAIAIGVALGLNPKVLTDVINSSSGQCWSSTVYNPVPGILPNVPSSNDYKAGFSTQLIFKDLGIARKAAKNIGLPFEVGQKTYDLYETLCKKGLNEKDFSIIYELVSTRTKK